MTQEWIWFCSAPLFHIPPLHLEAPSWLLRCLGYDIAAKQDFTFEGYHADEFDQLLSADHNTGSFLSRLPFKRGTLRRPKPPTTDSSDSSFRSLFVDDTDAELFGDESISLLLTTQPEPTHMPQLPIGQMPSEGQDEQELYREEEQLRIEEERRIGLNRAKARKLAVERGLIRTNSSATIRSQASNDTASTIRTRTNRSSSVKSQMSMMSMQKSLGSDDSESRLTKDSILPQMRPS